MVVVRSWFQTAVKSALFAWLVLIVPSASGEPNATEALNEFLADLDHLSAEFDQTVSDTYGRVVEVSSGNLLLVRPNARWETVSPYPQTLILKNKDLEIYDPDLEQVTLRNISDEWQQVPLALLLGDAVDLGKHFTVGYTSLANGVEVFQLHPNSADAVFESVELMIDGKQLMRITIRDQAAQETVVHLRNHQNDVVVESDAFILDLPAGTDVIRG